MNSVMRGKLRLCDKISAFLVCALALLSVGTAEGAKKDSLTPAELFNTTNVYTAHFRFTEEQWKAMEPETEARFGGPAMARRFGPGMMLAPAFVKAGDKDKDKQLTKEEFAKLAEEWFVKFDKEKNGNLTGDLMRDGLNGVMGSGMPRIQLQGESGKRNGLASTMGVEFDYVKADLEFADRKFTNVAVRYKGNGTWMMSQASIKRSMKVDLNEFVKGQKIAGISKLNFHNAVTDASWMNEVLSHAFYRDIGVLAPRTAYTRVYVTVPGKYDKQYLGLYSLVENIDNNFLDERLSTSKGTLFKPVTPELFADLGDDWSKYRQTYDPKDDPAPADAQRVIAFAKLVTHANDEVFAQKLPEFLDLDQFAGFMAGTVWLSTLDSILGPGQNYYMYLHHKTRKFQFYPWDLDHSFGQFFLMGDQAQRNDLSIHKPWRGENRFLERVYAVPAFKTKYEAKLKEINENIGRPERITKQVDQIAAAIRPAVKEESAEKLARFEKAASGEGSEPAGMPGGGAGGPPGMNAAVQPIKKFVVERNKSIEAQLAGKSKGADIDAPSPGMARNFGLGTFLGPMLVAAYDKDDNESLSREEMVSGFSKLFEGWDKDNDGIVNEEQLTTAINEQFAPGRGRPGGAGGNRPPVRPPE